MEGSVQRVESGEESAVSDRIARRRVGASEPPFAGVDPEASIDLYWLPLGAGGHFVRFNGCIYEAICALREHRQCCDLYHSALQVHIPEGRFVIEMAWPIPNLDRASRGVVVEGPVGSRTMARFRLFRYEVRRWQDGVIPDVLEAVASQRISNDVDQARRVLQSIDSVPPLVWGRSEPGTGDMWNSNSMISWVLERTGVDIDNVQPPNGGRAPGWKAGVAVARGLLPTPAIGQMSTCG
jgi:hypothetical protein